MKDTGVTSSSSGGTSPQHSLNHYLCSACDLLRAQTVLTPDTPFSVASEIWLRSHSQYIRPSTAKIYSVHVKIMAAFFQELPVGSMHVGHVRSYQNHRCQKASNSVINKEIRAVLIPMLKEVDAWHRIEGIYRPLPARKKIVRKSMSEEEERRFLAVALDASKGHRILAGHCLVIMHETTMGFGELRHLKREDVVLDEQIPYVTVNEATKNDFRIRTIPLNWLSLRSMRWILHRWQDLGGTEPSQYLLPHRGRRQGDSRKTTPDFRRPMGKIDRAAHVIFEECGLPDFVPYDMRSCAITKLRNNADLSEQMQQELAGHSNQKIARLYSRQRLEKKAVAMEKIALDPAPTHKLIVFSGGKK